MHLNASSWLICLIASIAGLIGSGTEMPPSVGESATGQQPDLVLAAQADAPAVEAAPELSSAFEISSGPLATTCPKGIRKRKEFRSMTAAEWTAFVNATRQLMQGQASTAYDSLVNMRITYARSVIGYPQYLPWQRRYLQEFERRLQAINPNVMIPYWDTGLDSQAPASSPLFSSKYLGGNGVSPNNCVSDGPFAGWNPYYPRKHCLARRFDRGTTLSAFHPTATIEQLLTNSRDYVAIRTALEYSVAARPANSIGGDMVTIAAPNDPIFWLQAAFIDKLWADWQQRWPAVAKSYAGANANGSRAALTDKLTPLSGAVGDVMATSALCYAY